MAPADLPQDSVFLATYFVGNGEGGVYLAISDDGYRFRPLVEPNVPIITPTIGKDRLMRDPCLIRGGDGRWHLVWTTGWWDRSFGLAHSKDLVHWSEQSMVPAMSEYPNAINAWAPEVVFDPTSKEYVFYWSSTIRGAFPETSQPGGDLSPEKVPLNHRFYSTRTKDFHTFTKTQLLWDPGFNCIDATLMTIGRDWVMIAKDETKAPTPAKFLFVAQAPKVLGPFKITAPRITGEYWAEGPTAVRIGNRTRVYFDRYTEGRWGAVESTDLKTWTDVTDRVQMVKGARHGTVQLVSRSVVDAVKKDLESRTKE